MIDQRFLPEKEIFNSYTTVEEVAEAIKEMVIRGAPAIGCAAAFGVALAASNSRAGGRDAVLAAVKEARELLSKTRPTAANLFWALERMAALGAERSNLDSEQLVEAYVREALEIQKEDEEANRVMGHLGAELLPSKAQILTHCNTGALATGGYGTALGVIRAAVEQGKDVTVYANETRPWLQGARLTSWELLKDGIDVTVVTDSTAGVLMRLGSIDVAIVGADRIAANGDVANKIGTYTVAVLCRHHGIPFFVAAPTSTIDIDTPTGEDIPIEERPRAEITKIFNNRIVPRQAKVKNFAFDTTPAEFVSAIITEKGVARPPYEESLKDLMKK